MNLINKVLETIHRDPQAKENFRSLVTKDDHEGIFCYCEEVARRLGFEVSRAEIMEAVKEAEQERRENTMTAEQEIQMLTDEEVEDVAGGSAWRSEDGPDGHELDCTIFYHGFDYSWQNGVTCNSLHYCTVAYLGLEKLNDYPRCGGMFFVCAETDNLATSPT